MARKVAIFGAGVGGLTAAHEFVRRGYEVSVYERNDTAGGFFAVPAVKPTTCRPNIRGMALVLGITTPSTCFARYPLMTRHHCMTAFCRGRWNMRLSRTGLMTTRK